jgi:hypothetical protein
MSESIPGYSATLQFLYSPTAEAQQALEVAAAIEIGEAILSKQSEPGPAALRHRRLLIEWQQIMMDTVLYEKRLNEHKGREYAATNDGRPNLARRLLAISREREKAAEALQESQAALEAIKPLLAEAQRELAEAAKFKSTVAIAVLETQRRTCKPRFWNSFRPVFRGTWPLTRRL